MRLRPRRFILRNAASEISLFRKYSNTRFDYNFTLETDIGYDNL